MRKFLSFIIISIFIISLSNCRTVQLNQDGRVLGIGNTETSIGGGAALTGGVEIQNDNAPPNWYFAPNINLEIQQRFGLTKKTELQIKGHSDFTMMGYNAFYFDTNNEIDLGIKVNIIDSEKYGFSILPLWGTAIGFNNGGFSLKSGYPIPMYVNPTFGLALIANHNLEKSNMYWGGTFNFSPNLFPIILMGLPSFETYLSFNLGWEIQKTKVIYRHEMSFFTQYNFRISPIYNTFITTFSFGISYHFSAAFRQVKE